MSLLVIVLASAVILTVAYWTYGPILSRLLQLNPDAKTPAHELRDDVDYQPLEPNALLSQHFSAIAAAGPIVGPILAGVMFGWLPALIWILVGSIFIGGVHDMSALVASIRHKARSIAEVVREFRAGRISHDERDPGIKAVLDYNFNIREGEAYLPSRRIAEYLLQDHPAQRISLFDKYRWRALARHYLLAVRRKVGPPVKRALRAARARLHP